MANPSSKTDVCNLALSRIGSKTVTEAQITADTDVIAVHCNRHYEQTRDALLRSNAFWFARERASLVESSTPPFEYSNSYKLPDDFLSPISVYDGSESDGIYRYQYAIEGKKILINEDSCDLRYIKYITDVTEFDPLFIEVLVLSLSLKLVMPIAQDRKLYAEIKDELYGKGGVMSRVRAMDKQETNTKGRAGKLTWNESRY